MYDEKTYDFVLKAKEIHGDDLYDYRQFIYVTCQTKGIIICRIHGPFLKTPLHHLQRKQGCKQCSNLEKSIRSTLTLEQFAAKARKVEVHGDFYDYSQFIYVNNKTKGIIICPIHGPFNLSPAHHLSGYGCHPCAMLKSKQNAVEKWGVDHHTKTATYREKVKRTSQERFGFDHRSKAPDFRDSMKKTNIERYGVEFVSQMPKFQTQVRATNLEKFGALHYNMAHISDDAMLILNDKEMFGTLLETNSINEAAKLLGVTDGTVRRYCRKYSIELSNSSYEDAIAGFLRNQGVQVNRNNRSLIRPWEIDLVLPEHQLGIEFSGLYWHREQICPEDYHLTKLRRIQSIGYRLITIFEDEWLYKRSIVEDRLLYAIGKSQKGKGARQLTVRPITGSIANQFLCIYHIQGAGIEDCACYGAFDGETLVAVMMFARPWATLDDRTEDVDELIRFATNGISYPGIASRLFTTFVRDHKPSRVISYADRRWSEGKLYRQLGFIDVHETIPNYWYLDLDNKLREHRFNYRKDKIKHLVEDGDSKTEQQIMIELGRDRIWDCGSLKFQWAK
jgi:hypothetical protein